MAQALRDPLSRRGSPSAPSGCRWRQARAWLAALPVLAILGPVLPGLYWALAPSLDLSVWRALWSDVQWPQALRTTLEQLVGQGLRAQLKMTSLLTGKLYIDLALHPGSEARVQGREPDLFEVPTLPSGLEQITRKLESLPLSEILNKVAVALDGINSIINSHEARKSLRTLDTTLARIDSLAAHVDAQLPALTADLRRTAARVSSLAATAENLLDKTDRELPTMSRDLQQLFASLEQAVTGMTRTLANIEQLTAKDADLAWQLSGSLTEVGKAATSVRRLADYLQQNPNALLFGQGKEEP